MQNIRVLVLTEKERMHIAIIAISVFVSAIK
jgi:hypothetical protein